MCLPLSPRGLWPMYQTVRRDRRRASSPARPPAAAPAFPYPEGGGVLPVFNHEVETRRWPYVTICLIGLNVLVVRLRGHSRRRASSPSFSNGAWSPAASRPRSRFTTCSPSARRMFLHAGAVQLLGNMVFLYVVGDAVEDAFGRWWYLGLYLASGFFGTMVYVAMAHGSAVPVVGVQRCRRGRDRRPACCCGPRPGSGCLAYCCCSTSSASCTSSW